MDIGGPGAEGAATEVDHALDRLSTALDHLVKVVEDGGLDGYDDSGLAGFAQAFERCRNRLSLVDHRVVTDCETRQLADRVGQPSVGRLLVQLLRLSAGEASRRVHAAQACTERVTVTGEVLAPVRPHLAAAQRAGTVSPEQVHLIARALAGVDRPGFDPAHVDAGERLLTDFARTFGVKDLKHLADRTVEAIDPDGTLPDDQLNHDRRHLTLRPRPDGTYTGEFRLTGPAGAKLTALLHPLTRPHPDTPTSPAACRPDGSGREPEPDRRTHGQRAHDALEEICDRVLRAGDTPGTGGTPATVIVTIDLDQLTSRTGCGTTTDGTPLTTRQVLDLAREADIVPAVLTHSGAVLDLGRTRRIASHTQTLALIARDHGCSFPTCDRPPQWCERHHITEWINGGPTNLNNLTLLCRYHHHNHANRGWTCQLNPQGLPEWRPPSWLDPTRTPLINSRITAHLPQAPPIGSYSNQSDRTAAPP